MTRFFACAAFAAALLFSAGDANAQACQPGSYSVDGSEPCTPCAAGTLQPASSQTSCDECPAGTFSGAGAASCFTCVAGTFSSAGSEFCTQCNAGSYSAPGSQTCSSCLGGTYSAAGAGTCDECNAGSFSNAGSATCTACSPGSFSSGGAATCTGCSAGTYQDSVGQSTCFNCPPGTFQLGTGSSTCDACPGGAMTPCNGNGTCSDGPTGDGTCACNPGYTGVACENGPPPTSTTTTTTLATVCAAAPQSGCIVPAKAGFQIKQTIGDASKSTLKWKVGGGDLTVMQADLGDPTTSTSWTLCIYDRTAGVPEWVGDLTVDWNSFWTSIDPKGWKYEDKTASQDGVTAVQVKTGAAGTTKAQLKGKGANLSLPAPFDVNAIFDQDTSVTVQLVKGGPGAPLCWTSDFAVSDTLSNSATLFKAVVK